MSDGSTEAGTQRSLATTSALLVVVVAVALRWMGAFPWRLYDFRVYEAGGRAVIDGADIYSVSAGGLRFTYPPFAAVLFSALAWLPDAAAVAALSCASLLGLAAVVVVGHRWVAWHSLAVIGLGALALEPVVRTLVLGQINLILMALVVLDLYAVPRRYRGWLIGLAAGIKLTPAVFVVVFALRRDWRSCARSAAAFGLTVVVSWFVAPTAAMTYWTGGVDLVERFGDFALTPANQSLGGVLMRGLGTADPPLALAVGLPLVVLAAALGVAVRQQRVGSELGVVVAVSLGALLVSPVSWSHHWVWVVPALLLLVRRRWFVAAWATGVLFYLSPIWWLSQDPTESLALSWPQFVVSGFYVLWAVALLTALALTTSSRVRTDEPDAVESVAD
jgi:alpha-1,2-mannosyltransferase